jgi:hypothetical protein
MVDFSKELLVKMLKIPPQYKAIFYSFFKVKNE